jgi:DNA polymerase III gamma/tau subunit
MEVLYTKTMQLVGNVHLIQGDSDTINPVLDLIRESGIEPTGNPDVYIREYVVFGVDDARELSLRALARAVTSTRRVFVIVASGVTGEAQNALLKTLEEPQGDALFFIIVPSPASLLPTLRSRAQIVDVGETERHGGVDAQAFLAATTAQRIDMLKPLLEKADDEKRDIGAIFRFLADLERILEEDVAHNTAGIKAIYRARSYASDKGALMKPLLEQVALLIPMV